MDNIKKFEDFLDRMQGLLDNAKKQGHIIVRVEDLENTFPELKESEDEKIRKEIVDFINRVYERQALIITDEEKDNWIAWLEKQGEPTDINPSEFDLRLNKLLKQFETLSKEELVNCLSFYLNLVQNNGTYKADEKQGEQKPKLTEVEEAVKNLMNTYRDAIKAFQSTWFLEELKKIEKKPAKWSEEDEIQMNAAIDICKNLGYTPTSDWLKSLKDRVQPKQEWSDEDESTIKNIIEDLEYAERKGVCT